MELRNKKIWIISPDKWGVMKVSKHNYAIELAKRGNQVYFIQPPNLRHTEKITIKKSDEFENLNIVSFKPVYRGKRFLPKFLFNLLLKKQIKLFKTQFNHTPDVVIDFYLNTFENLQQFDAQVAICFAADLYNPNHVPQEVFTADFCIGVTDSVVALLKKSNPNSFFINHGLNETFVNYARLQLENLYNKPPQKAKELITVGYIGNLQMSVPHRKIMRSVVENNKNIKFIFWGQYDTSNSNLDYYKEDEEVFTFIDFLQKCNNVELKGPKNHQDIIDEIGGVDLFWICYNQHLSWAWDGSNSHKVMEYLSTGKPLVSHFMSTYKKSDIFYMLDTKDNSEYEKLFNTVIEKIKAGEDKEIIAKRLKFAISNSYINQIVLIEQLISKQLVINS